MTESDRMVDVTNTPVEPACVYDAGDIGCGEGLHMEFRRRVQSVQVGELIEVILRDPSAKEDLPPLARMMGHRIRAADELGDGRLRLVVQRSR
jgi:TusA-related sulfurtransferase